MTCLNLFIWKLESFSLVKQVNYLRKSRRLVRNCVYFKGMKSGMKCKFLNRLVIMTWWCQKGQRSQNYNSNIIFCDWWTVVSYITAIDLTICISQYCNIMTNGLSCSSYEKYLLPASNIWRSWRFLPSKVTPLLLLEMTAWNPDNVPLDLNSLIA